MTQEPLEITLKTLTPLWVGDMDHNSGAVKESGLLGSLRSWFEEKMRSSGFHACDPTGDKRCKPEQVCPACDLFGSTGHARQFRMEVEGLGTTDVFFRADAASVAADRKWLEGVFRGHKALWGESFRLRFFARPAANPDVVYGNLKSLVRIIAEKGGLGSKTQQGFGQLEILSMSLPNDEERGAVAQWLGGKRRIPKIEGFQSSVWRTKKPPFGPREVSAQNILNPPSGFDFEYIPCSFYTRATLRAAFTTRESDELFGYVKLHSDKAEGSRIHVSHWFREGNTQMYRMKIWGVVPGEAARRKHVWDTISAEVAKLV